MHACVQKGDNLRSVQVRVYRTPKQFFPFIGKAGREQLLNNLDMEVQTKIQRRSDDPVFNETFTVNLAQKVCSAVSVCCCKRTIIIIVTSFLISNFCWREICHNGATCKKCLLHEPLHFISMILGVSIPLLIPWIVTTDLCNLVHFEVHVVRHYMFILLFVALRNTQPCGLVKTKKKIYGT